MNGVGEEIETWLSGFDQPAWTIDRDGDGYWIVGLHGWGVGGRGPTLRSAAEQAVDQVRVVISHRHRKAVMSGTAIPHGGNVIWHLPDQVIDQIVAGHN